MRMESIETIRSAALEHFESCPLMALATVSPEGEPLANVMLFRLDSEMNVYFVTRPGTRKLANVEAGGRAAVTIGFEPPFNLELSGQAERVTDAEERARTMEILAGKAASVEGLWPPVLRYSHEQGSEIYRIRPDRARLLDMREQHIAEEQAPFYDLI